MKCRKRYKDMEKYRAYRERWKERYRKKNGAFLYRHPYTQEEDEMIQAHNIPDVELSVLIQHSVGAIQKRRWQLKKRGSDIDTKRTCTGGL